MHYIVLWKRRFDRFKEVYDINLKLGLLWYVTVALHIGVSRLFKNNLCAVERRIQRKNPHQNRMMRTWCTKRAFAAICNLRIREFIAKRLLRFPKSSESIDLREGCVIFNDFKNAIKTMIKTWYIKSSISIESSFHVDYNELGFNSVKLINEQILTLIRKCRVRSIYMTSWPIFMTKFCRVIWYNVNITCFKFQVNSSNTLENTAIFVSVL